jgi:putative nucleotidyltransferase with HDIG domain
MPDTNAEQAFAPATRLRQRMSEHVISDDRHAAQITLSVGLSTSPLGATGAEDLVRQADAALYAAKKAGRNAVRSWEQVRDDQASKPSPEQEAVRQMERRLHRMSQQAKEMFVQSMQSLVSAQEARDPNAKSHADHVTRYATAVAETMGLADREVDIIRRAALVHDVGKIGVPDSILTKEGRLTASERQAMEDHVLVGVQILAQLRFLDREIAIVRHHHERWDGKGYPDGCGGPCIPLGARILAVADALDAMTAERVYHAPRRLPEALAVMEAEAGRQFDPEVVDGLLRWVGSVSRRLGTDEVTVADLLATEAAAIAV